MMYLSWDCCQKEMKSFMVTILGSLKRLLKMVKPSLMSFSRA